MKELMGWLILGWLLVLLVVGRIAQADQYCEWVLCLEGDGKRACSLMKGLLTGEESARAFWPKAHGREGEYVPIYRCVPKDEADKIRAEHEKGES